MPKQSSPAEKKGKSKFQKPLFAILVVLLKRYKDFTTINSYNQYLQIIRP